MRHFTGQLAWNLQNVNVRKWHTFHSQTLQHASPENKGILFVTTLSLILRRKLVKILSCSLLSADKPEQQKKTIDKLGFMKIKNFCASKDTINGIKRQFTE